MKKFLSLLCAVMFILSANAVPAKGVKALKGQKVQFAELNAQSNAFVNRAEKAVAPVKAIRKAAKAEQATTDVTVSVATSTYYASDGDVYYVLYNEDKTIGFCFDIYCATGDEDVVSGKTYTLADMYADYCEWAFADDPYNGTAFASCSFTKTVAADGSFTIVASATDINGDVWNLSYAQGAPVITHKTLNLNGIVELGTSYQQIEAANADTTELVSLIVISDNILGTFTADDLFSYYSYVLADSAEYEIQEANFTVAYENGVYSVTGTLGGVNYNDQTDIVVFTLNLTCTGEVPPAPFPSVAKDTVAIDFGEIKNIEYYASDGDYYIYAANANYIATLDLYTDSLPGIYTIDDFYTYYTHLYAINAGDTAQVGSLKDANAVIAETETAYDITAGLYMSDTILYVLHMTYTKPVASDTIYHTFAEPVSLDNYGGDFYFKAVDDSYILTMDYYSTTATGTFALTDMYTDYCGLYNAADSSSIAYADLGLVVTEDETGYDILVNYLAKSSTLYIFTLRADKAVAEDTVQLNLENAEFEDLSEYASYYGFSYYVKAATADSSYVMTFAIISNKMEGTYTVADLVLNYSWIKVQGDYAMYVEGEFNVTAGENGSYTLAGEILANDNTLYQFTIKTAETQAIENAEVAGKATKRLVNGQLIIEKNGVLYNVLGTNIK